MIDVCRNRAVLGSLYAVALGAAFFRRQNPRRKAAGGHLAAFHDRVWRDAAARAGASYTPIGAGVAEIERGGRVARVSGNVSSIDDPVTLEVAANKPLTYRFLATWGLPTPRHAVFTLGSMAAAAGFLRSGPGECVVKPAANTGGGRGVSTGIRTPLQLARAAATAAVYADELLIEEQQQGDNYRLLYLDGRLLDAFVRRPPTVVADGRSTVAALVRRSNEARDRFGATLSQVQLTVDYDMKRTLAKQGLALGSVPAEGTVVTVKTVVNENCGADNATATHLFCPEVIAAGAQAAGALRVRLAGVDLITRDPSVPLAESGGTILEVNTPPNYYYHYNKRDGAFPVAVHVLEQLLPPAPPRPGVPDGAAPARAQEVPL